MRLNSRRLPLLAHRCHCFREQHLSEALSLLGGQQGNPECPWASVAAGLCTSGVAAFIAVATPMTQSGHEQHYRTRFPTFISTPPQLTTSFANVGWRSESAILWPHRPHEPPCRKGHDARLIPSFERLSRIGLVGMSSKIQYPKKRNRKARWEELHALQAQKHWRATHSSWWLTRSYAHRGRAGPCRVRKDR
jgi:hypothetical protein